MQRLASGNLARLRLRIRWMSSTVSSDVPPATSKRKQFRNIVPDPKLLAHLDDLRLGYCPKRKMRVAVAKKYEGTEKLLKGRNRLGQKFVQYKVMPKPFPFQKLGRLMFVADHFTDIPKTIPGSPSEVAIIGRSNVGKSTLFNTLLGFDSSYEQKAIVENKPGVTRQLEFFSLGVRKRAEDDHQGKNVRPTVVDKSATFSSASLVLVDMPGYGFAFLSEKDKERCDKLCFSYLRHRGAALKRVLLLLDARHGFKVGDKNFFMKLMKGDLEEDLPNVGEKGPKDSESGLGKSKPRLDSQDEKRKDEALRGLKVNMRWKLQVVLTKCDLVDRADLARRIQLVADELSEALPGLGNMLPIIPVCGQDGCGVIELQKELASLVSPVTPPQPHVGARTHSTSGFDGEERAHEERPVAGGKGRINSKQVLSNVNGKAKRDTGAWAKGKQGGQGGKRGSGTAVTGPARRRPVPVKRGVVKPSKGIKKKVEKSMGGSSVGGEGREGNKGRWRDRDAQELRMKQREVLSKAAVKESRANRKRGNPANHKAKS